jgi:hypothetical protein
METNKIVTGFAIYNFGVVSGKPLFITDVRMMLSYADDFRIVFSTGSTYLLFLNHVTIPVCPAPPNLKINLSTKPKEIILSWDHPLIMNGPLEKFGIEINEKIMEPYNITERKYQRTYNYTVSWLGFIAQILIFAIRFQLKKKMSTELAYGE